MSYQETRLWSHFEAAEDGSAKHIARRLAEQFLRSREHALLIAGEINRDAPDLTQHDITHIDALWEYADLICGREYSLNPAELFVLGISFLVHDLANGLAAIPNGQEQLEANPRWRDVVAIEYRALHGVYPRPESLDEAAVEVRDRAILKYLRETHAEYAAQLPLLEYPHSASEHSYYLIEDVELRTQYGHLAGRIAASHWWSSKLLRREFGVQIGARANMPDSWKVDPLVLACILRCSDAAHLDSRRAPGFLRALRKPDAQSDAHWIFQDKLQKPHLKDDRLVYTSLSPFNRNQSEAWWLCYETLSALDGELSAVDSILSDSGRVRLQARSVAGIRDVEEMSRNITTDGWHPIDARLKVTDVVSLVARLGGKELYGPDPRVAIRELITNAADAVRAKRTILEVTGAPPWEISGDITATLQETPAGAWLSIRDTGIGMSKDVLSGALLNFGTSYWDSIEARRDLPGLISSGFRPTGQFGIGFFSTFMIGDAVKVISRRYDASTNETYVLEFKDGISRRPILRAADANERLMTSGTEVQIALTCNVDSILNIGLDEDGERQSRTFSEMCGWLCPALDVDLYVYEDGARSLVVGADDWKKISDAALMDRIYVDYAPEEREALKRAVNGPLLTIDSCDGQTLARMALARSIDRSRPDDDMGDEGFYRLVVSFSAPVVVGGVRSGAVFRCCAGLVLGKPINAARDMATPLLEAKDFSSWATRQAVTLDRSWIDSPPDALVSLVCELYGDTDDLNIAESVSGAMSYSEIVHFCTTRNRVVLVHDAAWHNFVHRRSKRSSSKNQPRLRDDVILVSAGRASPLSSRREPYHNLDLWAIRDDKGRFIGRNSQTGMVLRAVAEAWAVAEEDILNLYEERDRRGNKLMAVGDVGSKDVRLRVQATLERAAFNASGLEVE